jgi:hypothetical protein
LFAQRVGHYALLVLRESRSYVKKCLPIMRDTVPTPNDLDRAFAPDKDLFRLKRYLTRMETWNLHVGLHAGAGTGEDKSSGGRSVRRKTRRPTVK